jgi:polysaccharide biosynthesis protein PslH
LASSSARKGRARPGGRPARGRKPAASQRPKLLFLASQLPYPPHSGGAIKTLSVIEHLSRTHDIRLISFSRRPLTADEKRWADEFGARIVVLDRKRGALSLVKSYISRVPMSIERNRSKEMEKLIADSINEGEPDVVFVDGWLMAQYLPDDYKGLRILHEHNAEHEMWERQAELESGPRKPLASKEADRVKKYEASLLGKFDVVFVVSDRDRRALRDIGGAVNKIRLLPNIPDRTLLDASAPSYETTQPLVLYLATLSWQPNIEGVERFVANVFPLVRQRYPEARLIVAGRDAAQGLKKKVESSEGAEFVGEIDDPESLYEAARVFVDATRSGGGTRLKVLNALARGVPVVASPEAAAGLDIVPGEHLIVARNDQAMADGIALLMRDPVRWKILSQNGRALVRARYVAEVAFRQLDEALTRSKR